MGCELKQRAAALGPEMQWPFSGWGPSLAGALPWLGLFLPWLGLFSCWGPSLAGALPWLGLFLCTSLFNSGTTSSNTGSWVHAPSCKTGSASKVHRSLMMTEAEPEFTRRAAGVGQVELADGEACSHQRAALTLPHLQAPLLPVA